jgi:hypothetical protein
MEPKIAAAIAAIPEQAWMPIRYPRAIWDDQLRCWVSDAQVAETGYNLLRAAGSLASLAYGKARGATIRRDLIDVAARTARHGRGHITLHLPEGWHREHEWMTLFAAACGPPATAA